jgi:hypothetical protein
MKVDSRCLPLTYIGSAKLAILFQNIVSYEKWGAGVSHQPRITDRSAYGIGGTPECSSKKRMSSALASGPLGSV